MTDTTPVIPTLTVERDDKKRKTSPSEKTFSSKPTPGAEQTMLQSVEFIQTITVKRPTISTYVPNAHVMFSVLHIMDNSILSNRHWGPYLPRWTPLHSRLYYGTLFYIQIFRCMISATIAPMHIRNLMRNFEEMYPLDRLPIAGPLLPFFKALTTCQTPFVEYGFVSPTVPLNPGCTAANASSLEDHVSILLPNLVAICRGITNSRHIPAARAIPRNWEHNLQNTAAAAVIIDPAAANQQSRNARVTPGTVNPIGISLQTAAKYAEEKSHLTMPVFTPADIPANWEEYLSFDNSLQWFGPLIAQHETHSHFFDGSSTLASVSTLNGNTPLLFITQRTLYPNRDDHRLQVVETIDFTASGSSNTIEIPAPCDKYALLTQINFKPAPNFSPFDDTTGDIGVTRFGPWWDVSPIRLITYDYDPIAQIHPIVSRHFIMDQPKSVSL